jgi:hypothetical protein
MMKGKGVNPSYNAQAAIDAKSRMIVGGYVVNACCDSSELIPMIDEIESHAGKAPKLVSVDKGYTRLSYLTELERRNIDGYVSLRKRRKQKFEYEAVRDVCICPQGKELHKAEQTNKHSRYIISEECCSCEAKPKCWRAGAKSRSVTLSAHEAAVRRMEEKVWSVQGKIISTLRASTIEPFFGTMKFARKLRQLAIRGLQRVNQEWQFELAAYNIDKLCRVMYVS